MERKIFGQGSRLGSAKDHMLKILRLIRNSGKGDLNASEFESAPEDLKQLNAFNLEAYTVAKQRMLEIQAQKAMMIFESRHDRWKAGGPV